MIISNNLLSYPRVIVGNNIYMFTANSTLRNNGKLVIGRGCAKSVRDIYDGIDKLFGDVIEHNSVFGVKFVQHNQQWIGAFQTKIDWQKDSPLDVVATSIAYLKRVAELRPEYTFHLPCPAISNGGKSVDEILPMLECLPDNVIIYLPL